MEPDHDPSAPFRPGMLIGNKFVLLRLIAEGGMCAVFEAKDELIRRHVAIKLLRREYAQHAEAIGRFRREAELTASIQHPNVVSIHEMGQRRDGSFYIVEELLQGESLRSHILRYGRFSFEQALEILVPVMGALIAAHGQGIVHRDIKPENIVLARSASGELQPKLIDFGIAKGQPGDAVQTELTSFGELLGTPHYMSPEQVRCEHPLDARTDIWAIGVVLYELLSGMLPYGAAADPAQIVFARIIEDPPQPLRSVAPDVPESIAEIVQQAVEPELGRRLRSMQALRDELLARSNRRPISLVPAKAPEDAVSGEHPPAPPPARAQGESMLDPDELGGIDEALPPSEVPPAPSSRTGVLGVRPGPRAEVAWARESAPTVLSEQEQQAEAAERALGLNQLQEAITLAEQAIAGPTVEGVLAGRLSLVQAIAHRWLGNYEHCERCARAAAAHLERGSGGWYAAVGHATIAAGHLGKVKELLAFSEELKKVEVAEPIAHFHAIASCRLSTFLIRSGMPHIAEMLLDAAQQHIGAEDSAEALARAWLDVARAELSTHRGDVVAYLRRVEAAAEAFTAAGDVRNASLQRANIGNAYIQLGAYRRAAGVLREALDVAQPMGLDFTAVLQVNLGFVLGQLGEIEAGSAAAWEALRQCLKQNNKRLAGCALIYLATLSSMQNDIPRAAKLSQEALDTLDGDTPLRAYALATLAQLLLTQRKPEPALACAQEGMDRMKSLGGLMEEGESLLRTTNALSLRGVGREAEGRAAIAEARRRLLERAERIHDPAWRRSFLEGVVDNARVIALAAQWLEGGERAGGG
jgi:serine/threonine protein kinase/tetratricopeptide (TPR) repeat protein